MSPRRHLWGIFSFAKIELALVLRDKIMKSPKPLQGLDLIDCAKANANLGIATAARQCGYAENLSAFEQALKEGGQKMGIKINRFSDLMSHQQLMKKHRGIEISPDSPSNL